MRPPSSAGAVSARGLLLRLSFCLLAILTVRATGTTNGHFSGGTISFYFEDTNVQQIYKAHITVITGWLLGKGPCGPGCSFASIGQSTKVTRDSVIAASAKPDIFGSWTKEVETPSLTIDIKDVTTVVNQKIDGRVSSVSTTLNYEQEIAHVVLDIDTRFSYTDVALSGHSWRPFDLNRVQGSNGPPSNAPASKPFNLQTKIYPKIRNDTGKPNSSPLVMYKPIYKVGLDNVTEIRLTSSDKDGDLIKCRLAVNIEIDGIGQIPNVKVSEDCIVTISTMQHDGFTDNSWGIVGVVLEDYNRHPIERQGVVLGPYANVLSSSILDFMVWVSANMAVPEFVSPTPVSQHVYTVYAGSTLSIPLAAKPSDHSLPSVSVNTWRCLGKTSMAFLPHSKVVRFHLISLPDHSLANPPLKPDRIRLSDRVMTSSLEWRTSDDDAGDYIIQAVAYDSEGSESLDRNYKIHVSKFPQVLGQSTGNKPFFPFFPSAGSLTCLQGATCSVPIFAKPGTSGRVITSISLQSSAIPGASMGSVSPTTYRRVHVYVADVSFTAQSLGTKSLCFTATDNVGLSTSRCVDVDLFPPNPCDSYPCHKGGTCIKDGPSGYRCLCPPAFKGPQCDLYDDPCLKQPCKNGGTCRSSQRTGAVHICRCLPGFSNSPGNKDCAINDNDCVGSPCNVNGICVDKVNGFTCNCLNGFTGTHCNTAPTNNPCASKNCQGSSTCVIHNGQAVCKCQLGKTGAVCGTDKTDTPTIANTGTTTPHSVLPSFRPGSQITCRLGATCHVPVYINNGNQPSPPSVVRGKTFPGLVTSVTPAKPDLVTGIPHVFTSSLSVTPQQPGRHSACVEIENNSGLPPEEVCYTIDTPDPNTAGPAPPPATGPHTFTDTMLPDGSVINCVTSQPCHIIAETKTPPSGQCEKVNPLTTGAYSLVTRADSNSQTCGTDVLLEPVNKPDDQVCLVVGVGGEKRCYNVHTTDDTTPASDPCHPSPCQNSGVCTVDSKATNGFTCVCPVPYKGDTCGQVDQCSSDRCEHQAVCVEDSSGTGFSCHCQHGYSGTSCRREANDCSNKHCENGAICIMSSQTNTPECKCPMIKGPAGSTCHNNEPLPPLHPVVDTSKPHGLVPSPGQGSTVHCTVGSTCKVPVFLTGNPTNPPQVQTGPTSLGVTADITPPHASKVPPGVLTSSLSVTPTEPGHHHVCVDIKQTAGSASAEHICYNVDSSNPPTGGNPPGTNANPGGRFAPGTPPTGSEVRCRDGTPCHIIARTEKPPSGECSSVRTKSVGLYTFATSELDSSTCVTEVLVDPANLPSNKPACIQVGFDGEIRCYSVSTTDPANDPCDPSPCQHGGLCIPDSKSATSFTCACPVPYSGTLCATKDTCASGRCLNQAVCTDHPAPTGGFHCKCQAGYTGLDCRNVPAVCSGVQCAHDALCVEENGKGLCECPVGTEGVTCHIGQTDIPVNPTSNHLRPHLIVPSHGNGHMINCVLGQTCKVPLFLTDSGSGGPKPAVQTGPTSPGVVTDVTPPATSVTPHDTLVSTLSVTPKATGHHHVCVDVKDSGGTSDSVCYTVNVSPTPAATTPQPSVSPTGGMFAPGTPISGSSITCRDDIPCHLRVLTEKPNGQNCVEVQTQSFGVFTYPQPDLDPHTCTADVLVDPVQMQLPGDQACVQVGPGGERRCYNVDHITTSNDPCSNVHCQHGGKCIHDGTTGHTCACPVPYSGVDCSSVDNCQSNRCQNQAVCKDGTGITGFQCHCQPGYTGPDCRQAPVGCSLLQCDNGALCVEESGHAVCKCPLGTGHAVCNTAVVDTPTNSQTNPATPHSVVPSLGNGFQIDCDIGQTCPIPVYVHKQPGSTPEISAGSRTPGIAGRVSSPVPTNLLPPDTLTSTLSVTPTTPGTHHICVDVKDGINVDSVCYTVKSQNSGSSPATPAPHAGGNFKGRTPPDGAHITCRDDRPCHVIAQTELPSSPGASCADVATSSVGVYTYPKPADTACNTDILLDPKNIVGNKACIRVGTNGEERCFTVNAIDHTTDPCDPGQHPQCQHGGQCVNMPEQTSGRLYDCVCTPFYEGLDCEKDHVDTPVNTNVNKNVPHAVVPTPVNGMTVTCKTGDTCKIPVYTVGGGQVSPGPKSPDVVTSVGTPVSPTLPPSTQLTTLSVHPTKDGTHHACVDVKDTSGQVVDNICYTVESSTNPPATPAPNPGGGKFKEGTPPSSSTINCRTGLPCHMIVHTNRQSPSDPCASVKTQGGGVTAYPPVLSPSDPTTCDTDILIDPGQGQGNQQVCIEARLTANGGGETRCYNVQPITGDKCANSPCQNDGECVLTSRDPSGIHCVCPLGYSGVHCQTDECASSPCQNNGVCAMNSSAATGFTCTCVAGYSGDLCDTVVTDSCTSSPCTTGRCIVDSSVAAGFTCHCAPGYTGSLCDTVPVVQGCTNPGLCQNGAACVRVNGADSCKCPVGTVPPTCTSGSLPPLNPLPPSGQPQNPGQPPNSGQPQNPGQPPNSGQPQNLGQPQNPSQPQNPGQPQNPSQPQNPGQPHNPGHQVHIVQPTLPNQSEITCQLNTACPVPIYVAGPNPVVTGHSTPAVSVVGNPNFPHNTHLPPGVVTSQIVVTPHAQGRHRVCVDVTTSLNRNDPDKLCYTIVTPPPPTNTNGTPTPAVPGTRTPGFTPGTLPDGSKVVCTAGAQCHIPVTQTGSCTQVASDSSGVFTSASLFGDPCTTDVIIDPNLMKVPYQACIHIGSNQASKRCYMVVPDPRDPCDSSPCQNGGSCTRQWSTYRCTCTPDFQGATCTVASQTCPSAAASKEALRKAAAERRVRCTCTHPVTQQRYTVVRPRVSNERLFRAAGISSGVSLGLMGLAALGYFAVTKIKAKVAAKVAATAPSSGRGPGNGKGWPLQQRRGSEAWSDRGGDQRR